MLQLSLLAAIFSIFFGSAVATDCPERWIDCGNGKCVSNIWACDGDNDCGNLKDEENCSSEVSQQVCLSNQFQCAEDKYHCIPMNWHCDGENDCRNGSDEKNCDYPCSVKNGGCSHLCHTIEGKRTCVCPTGMVIAEEGLTCIHKNCTIDEFQCNETRQCVPKDYVCDGLNDCEDASDEVCDDPVTTCPGDDFQCSNGRCILNSWKCNNRDDCGDNSDEIGCLYPEACDKGQVRCSDGQCISFIWKCDGESDCTDGGDEKDCDKTTCDEETQIRCDDGQCIPKSWTCDGTTDCKDGTDERICSSKLVSCTDSEFRCHDGTCIDKVLACDRKHDCRDGSDERNCTLMACTEFSCEYSGECIPWTEVCDGNSDCKDLTDEGPQCYTACRDNGGCSQKCTKTPTGSKCSCISGYKLMDDGVTCEGCSIPGYCSQLCNKTIDGVECSCFDGYVLSEDRRKCKAEGGPATLVYLLPEAIKGLQIGTNNQKRIHGDEEGDMRGLDYDAEESQFFYTNWRLSTLNSYVSITNERITLLTAPIRPNYVKWDWLTRTLFYTNDDGSVVACNESGKYCATTVLNAAAFITSFDISPNNGVMFWSSYNMLAQSRIGLIERANLDGSERVVIVTNNTYWPSSVTVDEVTERIYWAEMNSFDVEFADFEGRQRKTLLKGKTYNPMSMTVFEDYLFFSDYLNDTIYRCDKFIGNDCIPVQRGNVKAEVIMILHKAKQSKGENRCSNNKCEHLCLPNRSGFSCKCSDGYELINSTCSLTATNTSQVHESPSTVDTNEYHETSIATEEEPIPASTPATESNVKRIWAKHLLPVIIGKEDHV